MTHQNLVLTEKAIKAHCKRLQKELKNYNQNLSLGETQNLFSKALGFNNFYELKNVLGDDKNTHGDFLFEELIKTSKNKQEITNYFLKLCKEGNLRLIKLLFESNDFINKPNLDAKDWHGNNYGALHQACWSGNVNLVKYLIEDLKIKVENEAWIFFYCRNGSVFKYIINHMKINNQNKEFIEKLKKILIRDCFYDYETFKEALKLNLINTKDEFTETLYNTINLCEYDNNKEMHNKHQIIKHLCLLGANLYDENNDIFIKLMKYLTSYENNTEYSKDYVNNKIRCIKDILNHLDKNYNYLTKYNIKEVSNYFKKNPDSLNNKWAILNNSYIKNLIEST